MTTLIDSPIDQVAPPPPPATQRSHFSGGSPLRRRAGVAVMLLATALLYLWNLSASGYANEFYAAAVQAGTKSWKAFLFGSSDWGNSITVDKPPFSLWPMEISARIFGFNSWSMLAPQALEGVAAVGLLYLTVKRWFGPAAGFIAGITLALTPIAVVMFRFNNPDAMMVLLITAAAYAVTRAIDSQRHALRWMALVGVCFGFGFLTKSLQAFTVLPAFVLMYVVVARPGIWKRLLHLAVALAALLVSAGWWIAVVALWPASSRPYIGGSTNNSALELAFGYNGLGRLSGEGNGGGANFSGTTGWGRLFNSEMGGQISWLLPAALIGMVALAVISRRGPRTDKARAAAMLWGGWLVVTGGILSFASGTIHAYYTVELAPAIAALVAIAGVLLWRRRAQLNSRLALAIATIITGVWSYELLQRSSGWHSWVSYVTLTATVIAALALTVRVRTIRNLAAVGLIAAIVAGGAGSTAYALSAASTAQTGSTPAAGPSVSSGFGGGGFGGGRGTGGSGTGGSGTGGGSFGGGFPGGFSSSAGPSGNSGQTGTRPSGGGGVDGGSSSSSALIELLKKAGTTWSAATVGSQTAASLQLSSDTDVMPIGGFTGSDNSPTLAQFEAWVKEGKIHYFIAGGQGGGRGGSGSASEITSWVESNFKTVTVGGTTVYDLTQKAS